MDNMDEKKKHQKFDVDVSALKNALTTRGLLR